MEAQGANGRALSGSTSRASSCKWKVYSTQRMNKKERKEGRNKGKNKRKKKINGGSKEQIRGEKGERKVEINEK